MEEEDDDALYEALGEDNNDLDEDQFESILVFKKEERVSNLMKRRLLSMLLSKTSDVGQLDESEKGVSGGGGGAEQLSVSAPTETPEKSDAKEALDSKSESQSAGSVVVSSGGGGLASSGEREESNVNEQVKSPKVTTEDDGSKL